MTRRFDDLLDDVLEDLERAGQALGAIAERRRQRARGLSGPIELEEVRPGVYQSKATRTPAVELLEDVRRVRDALRPELPDAIVTTTVTHRRRRSRG
jgi:hypothetical protein